MTFHSHKVNEINKRCRRRSSSSTGQGKKKKQKGCCVQTLSLSLSLSMQSSAVAGNGRCATTFTASSSSSYTHRRCSLFFFYFLVDLYPCELDGQKNISHKTSCDAKYTTKKFCFEKKCWEESMNRILLFYPIINDYVERQSQIDDGGGDISNILLSPMKKKKKKSSAQTQYVVAFVGAVSWASASYHIYGEGIIHVPLCVCVCV